MQFINLAVKFLIAEILLGAGFCLAVRAHPGPPYATSAASGTYSHPQDTPWGR